MGQAVRRRWTRAGSARGVDQGGGSGGPGHGTPQAFNSAVELPRARLGRRQRSIGPGRAVDQGGSARDVGLGGSSVEDLGPHVARTPYMSRCSFLRSCDHSARGDQRQLLLLVDADYSCRSCGESIWYRRYRIGHRSAGSATEAEANGRQESTRGGSSIWYERADGADVAARQAAVGEEGQAEVANPTGPVRRGVGRGGRAPSAERR